MKVYFDYEGSMKEIYFDKILCFHGNITNQIKLYDVILNGLNGTNNSFLLNNTTVKKKELNIIEFSSNSIIDDLKMTSKSYNAKIIHDSLYDIDDSIVVNSINKILVEYQDAVERNYSMFIDENITLQPKINILSLENLIIDNFKLVSKDEVNISSEVELQLRIIAQYIHNNKDKTFYLLLKHFEHCLDLSQMKIILQLFERLDNVEVSIFSKSFELYEYLSKNCFVSYMVDNEKISKLTFSEIFFDSLQSVLTEEESKKLVGVLSLQNRYKKYIEIVSEIRKITEI